MFLPYGTAIFNARTNDILKELGDSTYKNLWCSDNVHIQEGIPKYIASLAIVQALFDRYYGGLSVLGDISVPNALLWSPYERRDNAVGVTDANRYLAQKCAIQANKFPFVVTDID